MTCLLSRTHVCGAQNLEDIGEKDNVSYDILGIKVDRDRS